MSAEGKEKKEKKSHVQCCVDGGDILFSRNSKMLNIEN
jgi:hypothetical protein